MQYNLGWFPVMQRGDNDQLLKYRIRQTVIQSSSKNLVKSFLCLPISLRCAICLITVISRFYIGLAVGLPLFSNISIIFYSCSNCSISAGKGHIKELAIQIVYLAFSLFVSRLISCFHAFLWFPWPILAIFHIANVFLVGFISRSMSMTIHILLAVGKQNKHLTHTQPNPIPPQ